MIKRLRQQSYRQKNEISDATNRLQEQLIQIEDTHRKDLIQRDTHIHNLNLTIREIQGSTSWKITAPLRKIVSAIRRILGDRHKEISQIQPTVTQNNFGLEHPLDLACEELPEEHNSYSQWIEKFDTINDIDRLCMHEEVGTWRSKPLLSIIMPVYNPPIDMLREAIDSIKNQT